LINSYNSDAPAGGGRGGRGAALAPAFAGAPASQGPAGAGAAAAAEQEDPDAPAGGRGRGGPPPRLTKDAGGNRAEWDVRQQSGLLMPPGAYQARLRVDQTTQTQPFTVLIDPRVAADGVSVPDLQEQFDHNVRVRELLNDANQVLARVRDARTRLRGATGSDAEKARRNEVIYSQRVKSPESIRSENPG